MPTVFQNILNSERARFLSQHHLDSDQMKAFHYMAACGSDVFGYNAYECQDCGHKLIHYNSCGNRHCPSCQWHAREDWVDKFQGFLLDIPYFHIVFTVPDSLNDIFWYNKDSMYQLLFKTSSQTLSTVCLPLYGQIGFTSILHTWGQTLWFHPHIHMIVSGGGISTDDHGTAVFKKAPVNFLASVQALSRLFKGKFIALMKKLELYDANGTKIDFLDEPYKSLVDELYSKDWVVYSKEPFDDNQAVLNYIARYSHRVAISNSRILNYDSISHTVTFRYKDYRDDSKQKEMTLDACEFIRRFMLHILPSRFIKIRHYGFMSNSNRKTKIPLCRTLLNQAPPQVDSVHSDPVNHNRCQCPKCKGKLILIYRKTGPNSVSHTDSS